MKKEIASGLLSFVLLCTIFISPFFLNPHPAFSLPQKFVDASGTVVTVRHPPSRAVSLVPGITEIIFKIGAKDALQGITYYSTYPPETAQKAIMGGFFSPSLSAIQALQPDLIFLSSLHKGVRERFGHGRCTLVNLDVKRLDDMFRNIDLLGKIFNKGQEASVLKEQIKIQFDLIERQSFRDMEVYALVTAGVKSNALRMSQDKGKFCEPGTINVILLSNMKLTPRAMTRAIISATEGKTAALQDLDIRSHYTPLVNQATGTGTDNMIVVQGTGRLIDNAGGHSKMGELIAKAVYEGVRKAVYRQNGLMTPRNIFQRLKERNIGIYSNRL